MSKKYKLTDETVKINGKTLHRIEALKDFNNVKRGDKGGFVESELNLSQKGNCWIYNNAYVYDDSCVSDNARIANDAMINDNALISGHACIIEDAKIYGNARVFGNALIGGYAHIYDNAEILDYAYVFCNAHIYDNARISGNARVFENAKVCGNTVVFGETCMRGTAIVLDNTDYIVFKNWWSSGRYFTWTRSNNMWSVGCFYGTGEELIKKAYKDSELSGREYERVVRYVESILAEENLSKGTN